MKPLTGVIKNYAWGSTAGIPKILGTAGDGSPQAEYWLGAHPGGPASVDGTTLDKLIEADPSVVGEASVAAYGPQLPFLLKILSASEPLSLQAHPNQEQAAAGFAAEEARGLPIDDPTRTFKDTWHKPELMVALTPFEALAGFRDPAETIDLFGDLGLSSETINSLLGPLLHRSGEPALAQVFLDTLCLDDARRYVVDEVVSSAVRHAQDDGELGVFARTAVLLDNYHPGDPGIIAALLMNRLQLQVGEGLLIGPGVLHAYLEGTGVEVMASSDNVLRGGLTSKHIDVNALVDVVDFTPSAPRVIPAPHANDAGVARYQEDVDEFSLWRLDLKPGVPAELPAADFGRILLVVDGYVVCEDVDGAQVELVQGQAAFVAAGEQITASGDCRAFLASAGTPEE